MVCRACGYLNPLHLSVCENCGAIIRNRVANIDFGNTLLDIMHRPGYAFTNILFSEKKNLSFFLFFVSSFKILVINYILLAFLYHTGFGLWSGIVLNFSIVLLIVLLLTFLLQRGYSIRKVKVRQREIFAAYSFSTIPSIIFLIVFLPLELVVFGEFLFVFDPSPFLIDPVFAYLFLALEILFLLWQAVLFSIALNIIRPGLIKNIIISLIMNIAVYAVSFILFSYAVEINRRILLGN